MPSCVYLSFTNPSQGPGSGASSLSLAALTSTSTPTPHPPPSSWHRVNYSLRRNYTCVPRDSPPPPHPTPLPTTNRQKKMSLLPWWCQVMDFMFTSGVQVKTWGSRWRWPSQPRHLYQSCVQTYRLPWGSIKGDSAALVSMSDLFVCCGILLWML